MLVGALGMDAALLCVAADEGIKPQTLEHFQIIDLLPARGLVVALTRCDLADEHRREEVAAAVRRMIAQSRFAGAPVLPVSSVTGEGLTELKETLDRTLGDLREDVGGAWYLPIDRAFTVQGHGCVVTGTLARGKVEVGCPAVIQPGAVETRIRAIHSHNESVDRSEPGARTGLNLGGIKVEDVRRGQIVAPPGAVFETTVCDVKVRFVASVKHAQRVRVSIGAEQAFGRMFLNDQEPDIVQIRFESVIACALNQPLILRNYSPPDLIGGGAVLVPQAEKRRKSEKTAGLGKEGDLGSQIVAVLEAAPNGLMTEEICRKLGRSPQELGDAFERLSQSGRVRGLGGLWLGEDSFQDAQSRFGEALKALHEHQPTKLWQPREPALKRAAIPWQGKPLSRFLSSLESSGLIRVEGTLVKLAEFRVQLTEKQRQFLDRVIAELDKGGINSPSPRTITAAIGAPHQAIDQILILGIEAGEIVQLPEEVFYSLGQIDKLKALTRETFGTKPFTAAEFRDRLGSSRKYAIPLLEYLDSVGFTLRTGDARVIR
jgi:selenocysteine-specific elongation factor